MIFFHEWGGGNCNPAKFQHCLLIKRSEINLYNKKTFRPKLKVVNKQYFLIKYFDLNKGKIVKIKDFIVLKDKFMSKLGM